MSAARALPAGGDPLARARAEHPGSMVDLRVRMVLDVLAGEPIEVVAATWSVDPSLLRRWAGDFLVAGSAVVTHKPVEDEALQRDRFMAALAHELRTPVTIAQGWAMALADGDVPPSQVEASFEKLHDALGRLSEHILDVELSTAASLGRLRPDIVPLLVEEVVRSVPGMPGVRRGGELTVHADPRLLARVLRDLWRTASREPEPTSVDVDVVETGPWLEIRVVRTGEPLGHRVLQALIDPFGSNDDATGVTTGLYTARALAVAHGGIIGAEGDEELTTLLVRLPRHPVSVPGADGSGVPHGDGDRP